MVDQDQLISDFIQVANLAGIPISQPDVMYKVLPVPHEPPTRLPQDKKAVYVFCTMTECLKVGKAGPKSHARFTSQHYLPTSSRSNLAKSLVRTNVLSADADTRVWIRQNCTRHHFYLDASQPTALLNLLEAFIQCRLKPTYEGG